MSNTEPHLKYLPLTSTSLPYETILPLRFHMIRNLSYSSSHYLLLNYPYSEDVHVTLWGSQRH